MAAGSSGSLDGPSPGRRRALVPLLVVAGLIAGGVAATLTARSRPLFHPDRFVEMPGILEASGIAYWRERGTLILVSDQALVAEVGLDGRIVRSRTIPGYDFEDVVIEDDRRHALVVDESRRRLVRIRLDDFEIASERPLPRLTAKSTFNRQYEGLTRRPPRGEIVLAHEDHPAALVALAGGDGEAPAARHVTIVDAAGIAACKASDDGRLTLVLSRQAGLAVLAEDGRATPWLRLDAKNPEGAEFVPGVGLVICTDTLPSRLLFFPTLPSVEAVRDEIARRAGDRR